MWFQLYSLTRRNAAWSGNEDESKLLPQKESINLADASAKLVIQPENAK